MFAPNLDAFQILFNVNHLATPSVLTTFQPIIAVLIPPGPQEMAKRDTRESFTR